VVAQAETIRVLRAEVAQLRTRVAELERQLRTDSLNSSKPPSQDGQAEPAPLPLRSAGHRGRAGGGDLHPRNHTGHPQGSRPAKIQPAAYSTGSTNTATTSCGSRST